MNSLLSNCVPAGLIDVRPVDEIVDDTQVPVKTGIGGPLYAFFFLVSRRRILLPYSTPMAQLPLIYDACGRAWRAATGSPAMRSINTGLQKHASHKDKVNG